MKESRQASARQDDTAAKGKVRCLVIQMARLGDTLQSLMALKAAQELYPQLEVHVVVRERFADAVSRVDWLGGVHVFSSEDHLGPIIKGEKSIKDAVPEVAQWVENLVAQDWDIVLNWTYSPASSYLTTLIPARVKLGYMRALDGTMVSYDGWSQYIQAVIQGGVQQNIHLTDILTTQILTALQVYAGDPIDPGTTAVTSKSFFTLKKSNNYHLGAAGRLPKRIAVQLGAARQDKTWPAQHWADVVARILRSHPDHAIVLLGGASDLEIETEFWGALNCTPEQKERIVSFVGDTDFDQWVGLVRTCQWVMAGDTAVIHLASLLGIRVLNVSYGPVRFWETGPYGNGHRIIAPEDGKIEISPDAVYQGWVHALGDDQGEINVLSTDTRILRSRIRPGDEGGGVVYESIIPGKQKPKDWFALVMGQMAREWYCGWVAPVGQEMTRESLGSDLIQRLRMLQDSSSVIAKVLNECLHTLDQMIRSGSKLVSEKVMVLEDQKELKALGAKLLELDTLMDRLAQTHDEYRAFTQMRQVLMHNLKSGSLAEMARDSKHAYEQLADGIKVFRAWIDFGLKLARPQIVKDGALPTP